MPGQFAYNPMHVGRDRLVPVSINKTEMPFIVSPAYIVFEVIDTSILIPEYLWLWFKRPYFDRKAWFSTDNSVRGGFSWDSLTEIDITLPKKGEQTLVVLKEILIHQTRLNQSKMKII